MTLFGINRAIEYVEREINNVEYAKDKEEIRKHGTNTLVLCENFLKELLHTYIYFFDKDRYYLIVNDLDNTEEKMMFTLEKLRHSAIPRVTNFFCFNDKWYLVMDYIEGENLGQVMKRRGKIGEKEALNWFYQLCDVLGYLHNQNPPVVFRDLKPSNVMLTPDNQIKLIDFGIARHFKADDTSEVTSFISPGFSPPEQYLTKHADIRSDIYALGVLMHYLLTGCDPRTSNGIIVPFEQTGVSVSENFKNIIMKAVERDPNNRPSNIDEMVKAVSQKEINSESIFFNHIKKQYKNLNSFYKRLIITALIVVSVFVGYSINNYFRAGFIHENTAEYSKNNIVLTNEQLSLIMSLVSEESINKLNGFDETDKEKLKEIAKLQSKGSVEGNIDILNKMEEKYLNISEIYLLKGNNYMLSEQYKDAITECEKALAINSDIELAWNNKGICEIYSDDYEKAIESFKKAISISDQHADTWNNLAVSLDSLGRYEEALMAIEEALKLEPQLAEALINKGAYLLRLKRYEESLQYTEKALMINPYSSAAYINKGSALIDLGKKEEGKECYEKAINLNKYNYLAWYNLGLCYGAEGNDIEAVKCYDNALYIKPNFLPALNEKSGSLIILEKYWVALECSEKAISIDRESSEAYSNKGTALFFLRQNDEALEALNIALSIDETDQQALRTKAQILVMQKNFEDALELANKAIEVSESSYLNWILKSGILFYMGDKEEAKIALDKAKSLSTNKNSKAIQLMDEIINK